MKRRIGLMMKKVGCSSIYESNYKRTPITLLHLEDSYIVSLKKQERDGYDAVVIGYGDFKNIKKPQLAILKNAGISSRCKFYESAAGSNDLSVGSKLSIHFIINQFVDVSACSIGKGFSGVMKRHNFKGLRASHGVSIAHRSQGSTGQCQDPGRTFKGKKMAGHLGSANVTVQNLRVIYVDIEKSLIAVKGNNVPGCNGSYVFVRDAIKKNIYSSGYSLVVAN